MVHEKSGVGLDPAFCVTAEATTRDDQVDMRMPFHVSSKGVNMDCDIFRRAGLKTQYSIIPQFHYSNCERLALAVVLLRRVKAN